MSEVRHVIDRGSTRVERHLARFAGNELDHLVCEGVEVLHGQRLEARLSRLDRFCRLLGRFSVLGNFGIRARAGVLRLLGQRPQEEQIGHLPYPSSRRKPG